MGEGTEDERGDLTAQILEYLRRWPSKYPSPAKIAAATGRSPKEVIDELDRIRTSGELPALPDHFPAPPPRPLQPDEVEAAEREAAEREAAGTRATVLPAWDRSN
jgi:hypothetical protein